MMRWSHPKIINQARLVEMEREIHHLPGGQRDSFYTAFAEILQRGTFPPQFKQDIANRLKIEGVADQVKLGTLKEFNNFVTVGFELETQMTNGVNRHNIRERVAQINQNRPINQIALRKAIVDRYKLLARQGMRVEDLLNAQNMDGTSLVKDLIFRQWLSSLEPGVQAEAQATEEVTRKSFYKFMEEITDRNDFIRLASNSFPSGRIPIKLLDGNAANVIAFKKAAYLRAKAEVNPEQYRQAPMNDLQFIQNRLVRCREDERQLFAPGTDGSVEGFEIRTNGALTITQFVKAADILFSKNTHTIDHRCSFHIHVGLKMIRSQNYDAAMQSAMYEYLMEHINEVPESVLQRWRNSGQMSQYANTELSTSKYTFVHRHQRLGTWEFRCFGNVTNKKDALRCMTLAVRALIYAYEVAAGKKEAAIQRIDSATMRKCIDNGKPLSDFIGKPKLKEKFLKKKKG